MAKRLGPGETALGRKPLVKDKLEGPKVHHDYHGKTDSVPAKGSARAIPGDHWERPYSVIVKKDSKTIAGKEFNPMLARDRPCTHSKVNQEDH